ncbi:hypothetical protein BDV95DRAFT_499078 [Massariosphaeria phaeospora]|uniref:PH domain-containing protein n=1 Tax=Massariosphaeria phaeospora TaxID=100035 RepID=A0A7C8I5W6_9PLEO|nr:hypothetical protein BDV95DRAFT_499078 [Massariosphaeria phaeospora]
MATPRAHTPSAMYNSVPTPRDPAHLSRGYGTASQLEADTDDFATTPANPTDASPLSQSLQSQRRGRFEEDFDARTRGPSVLDDGDLPQRSASRASTLNQGAAPSRSGTLKKKASVKKSNSLKRSGSRRSMHAGSIRGVSVEDDERGSGRHNNVFYTPVPTSGSPTEVLANRFQAWRKLLKDLITYFREVGASYEHRAKALLKVSNVVNNTNAPSLFMIEGGLNDANRILRDFHKQSVTEANKAKEIETEVINQLSGLRADLSQKIKEIKGLSGDFKNNVEKEKEATRKCVAALEEALSVVDTDPSAVAGKGDPYVVRLGVDRQVERQIDEENYLHRAYLNLENSGRELESIVIGEIQKAYSALAGILKRDADEMYSTIDRLRNGPIGMPRDYEWNEFVIKDPHFVNPNLPLRRLEDIEYPGRHHPATLEVRAGMLERKSKYLKSYTPGWYVLSPTHLHEFKSADRIYTQPPVMSLYLPDQKLGSHSQPGSSSHKFVLKGRQTGSMHRGHTWVFRAETYDTMLAWYEDVKNLTEKTGEERTAYVRRHVRSASQGSVRSVSSDGGLEEDEADAVPYSASQSIANEPVRDEPPAQRPQPGGRFPSDIQVARNLQPPLSPSSGSSEVGNDITTASGGLGAYPNTDDSTTYDRSQPLHQTQDPYFSQNTYTEAQNLQQPPLAKSQTSFYANNPPTDPVANDFEPAVNPYQYPQEQQAYSSYQSSLERHDSTYGDWMTPAAGGAAAGTETYRPAIQDERNYEYSHQPEINRNVARSEANIAPAPVPAAVFVPVAVDSEPNSLATTPSNVHQTFLGNAEATGATTSSSTANGGSVVEGTGRGHPGMQRQNTDISVSDLHVPGEYPKNARA